MSNPPAAFEGLSHLIQNGKIDWEAVRSLPVAAEAATGSPFSNWTVTYEKGVLLLLCDVQLNFVAVAQVALGAPDGTLYCDGALSPIAATPMTTNLRMSTSTALFDPKIHGNTVESVIIVMSPPNIIYHEQRTFTV